MYVCVRVCVDGVMGLACMTDGRSTRCVPPRLSYSLLDNDSDPCVCMFVCSQVRPSDDAVCRGEASFFP